MAVIVPLDSPGAALGEVGGKAVNLLRLTRSGFRVPPGFVVTTAAYDAFVADNALEGVIEESLAALGDAPAVNNERLQAGSQRIRAAFSAGAIPPQIRDEIAAATAARLVDVPLAVRSSATAEDLPDLSFAGQQDTFLDVQGLPALLGAVVDCWSSLWTARAIGYRLANGIDQRKVALAVVVQQLVPADVSGVLFTANPLTGLRSESVVDAAPGLGEALVSGQVEPDHAVVDTATGTVLERTSAQQAGFCLTDAQVAELTGVGARIQREFGAPQDIEWAFAGEDLHVLQSRAITSLYPVPRTESLTAWFSMGAVQGLLEPISPLGQDALLSLAVGLGAVFGDRADEASIGFATVAGERLWARFDGAFRSRFGRRVTRAVLTMAEPGVGSAFDRLLDDPDLQPGGRLPNLHSLRRLAGALAPVAPNLPRTLTHPVRQRQRFERIVSGVVAQVEERETTATRLPDPRRRLAARATAARSSLRTMFPILLPAFAPIMGPSLLMMRRLNELAESLGPSGMGLGLRTLRALDGNVTTAMDLELWRVATAIRSDPATLDLFDGDLDDVTAAFRARSLPGPVQQGVEQFMERYGMRAVGEIDLGTPRWRERPVDVMRMLATYARIDPEHAPDHEYEAGRAASAEASGQLVAALRNQRGVGPVRRRLRARQARFLVSRIRGIFGARETPKFTIIRAMGVIRDGLLASARDLVAEGLLDRPEDISLLRLRELELLDDRPVEEWRRLIADRREVQEREQRRSRVPLVILSDGRAIHDGGRPPAAGDGVITGSPVSPGVVEGLVHVIRDPGSASLAPGEILVCPGTDPAWTPLFLAAGGLVTEVGGMMTHGSVVAREYGIPAVVGVHGATTLLATGQRIRLDGSNGTIHLLAETAASSETSA